MANLRISALTSATTPLTGTEVLPIVQSSTTVKVATNDLTVRNVRANATTGILQVTGPTAATTRVMTTPDANFTAARTDAGQTFTGTQQFLGSGGQNIRIYGGSAAHQWDIYGNGNNLRMGDNTGGGLVQIDTDLKLDNSNLVIGTSGKGVDFSATAGSGTSELLADYEEGTWTPIFSPTAGAFTSVTYTSTGGYYTKVGRLVCVTGRLRTSAITVGTASGSLFIGGLPFTSASTTSAAQGGTLTVADPSGWTVNNPCFGFVSNGATTILIQYRTTANGAASDSNVTDLGTVGLANNLAFTAYYFTA